MSEWIGRSPVRVFAAVRKLPRTLLFGRSVDSIPFAAAMIAASVVAILWLDLALAEWARGLDPATRRVWSTITQLGDGTGYFVGFAVYAGVCGALVLWSPAFAERHRLKARMYDGLFGFAAMAGTGLFVRLLKFVVARPRPSQYFRSDLTEFEWFRFSLGSDWTSYPSGHTQTIWTAALAVYLVFRLPAWPLMGVALLVSASRVLISAHYLGDVISGAWTGLFGVSMIYAVWRRYLPDLPVGAASSSRRARAEV
jgi:membrane-associated phospholipid phosphatase